MFISPAVITGTDPTRLRDVEHTGRGERAVFDRRNGARTTEEVRLFDVRYAGRGTAVESFGGNGHTGTVHIHTGDPEARSAYLEEVLFHEAAHVSLDPSTPRRPAGWPRSRLTASSSRPTRGTTQTART